MFGALPCICCYVFFLDFYYYLIVAFCYCLIYTVLASKVGHVSLSLNFHDIILDFKLLLRRGTVFYFIMSTSVLVYNVFIGVFISFTFLVYKGWHTRIVLFSLVEEMIFLFVFFIWFCKILGNCISCRSLRDYGKLSKLLMMRYRLFSYSRFD